MPPSKISPISCDSAMSETIAPAAVHRDLTPTLCPLFRCQQNCQDSTGRKQIIAKQSRRAFEDDRT